jgi:hypothetical protein
MPPLALRATLTYYEAKERKTTRAKVRRHLGSP